MMHPWAYVLLAGIPLAALDVVIQIIRGGRQ